MKNIRKSILLATALFVSTSVYANTETANNQKNQQQKEYKNSKYSDEKKGFKKYHGYKNHDKKHKRSHRGDASRFFIGAVYDLKLTKEQETKIDKIIQEFKNRKFDKFNSFTKEGFDKDAYIKARMKTKEDKIKLQADLIAKIYSVLDKSQIEQLDKEIKTFKDMKQKRGKNGSSCHDRG